MTNTEQEKNVCEGCGTVNPGTLKEKKGKILCLGCRANMEVINKEKYAELEKELNEKGIIRPKTADIRQILDLGPQQADAYRRVWKARNRQHYNLDAIQKAIKGEKITAAETHTPALDQELCNNKQA
jgi:hypothetical protein